MGVLPFRIGGQYHLHVYLLPLHVVAIDAEDVVLGRVELEDVLFLLLEAQSLVGGDG